MIRIKLLSRTNVGEDYAHSLLISLLRGLAALEVAAAHLRAQVYPGYATVAHPGIAFQGLAFLTGFAHQAVVVFFLLSGWLVGGSLLNKRSHPGAFAHYAIDRMTRLWIVLIPTFVLILVLGMVSAKVDPHVLSVAANNDYSASAFLGNLVGLQKIAVPTFGGNFPLWSLSNETWYYVLFPLLVIAVGTKSWRKCAASAVGAGALACLVGGPIMLYFVIWVMGAVGSRLELRTGIAGRMLLFLAFAAVALYFRMHGKNDDMGYESFPQDFLFSILFILFLTSMQFRLVRADGPIGKLKRVAKFFADFSFTLYVIHVPLIGFLGFLIPYLAHHRLGPNNPAHLAGYLGMYAALVIAAYLFHLPFEANTQRLRAALKSFAPQPSASASK